MSTAEELGLSKEEFEAAINLERMYALVNRVDCATCGKTPVTHADTKSWELLCNQCGKNKENKDNPKGNTCRKISITHFKSSEIEKFESRNGQAKAPARDPSPVSRSDNYHRPARSKPKGRKSRRYSSSSSPYDSSSESSYKPKKRSRKNTKKATRSQPPSNASFSYADPVNPPSAFAGADHAVSGMNAIKQQEKQLMSMNQAYAAPNAHPGGGYPAIGNGAIVSQMTPPNPMWATPMKPPQQNQGNYGPMYPLMVSPPRNPTTMRAHGYPNMQLANPGVPPRVGPSWSQPPINTQQTQQYWQQPEQPSAYSMSTPPRYQQNPFQSYQLQAWKQLAAPGNPFGNVPTQPTETKFPWNRRAASPQLQRTAMMAPQYHPLINDSYGGSVPPPSNWYPS